MLQELIERLPDALLVVDRHGAIFQVNSLAEEMFGYQSDEMVGQPVEILMPERYRSAHCHDRVNYFKNPEIRSMNEQLELYGLHKLGHQFAIEIHLSPLREGDTVWGLAAIRDIRTRKEMVNELRLARDDLEQKVAVRTSELAQVNESLHQELAKRERLSNQMRQLTAELAHVSRLSILGEMTAGLAHELNQPLTAISNYSQGCVRRMNKAECDPNIFIPVLQRITSEASRASEIITRFRQFSRKDTLQKKRLSMSELIHDAVEIERFEADALGVEIHLECQQALPEVRVDEIQIQQVMVNLLRNAIEVTHTLATDQKIILVKISREEGGKVVVAIEDCGHGFSKQQEQKIFQPFFTTKPKGLGMGLSISRSIVEAHGGHLWAESSLGNGATFFFSLPASIED